MTAPAVEIADAEIVPDADAPQATAVARREPRLEVAPQVHAAELVARLDTIKEAMSTAMVAGTDYGVIPGTNSKPSLLKPGAEKLAVLFQLDVQYPKVEKEWAADHLTVSVDAVVYHQLTGIRMGAGEGLCSTREKKYAKRKAQRACPECGVPAIIKGKAEYGGGWVCFKKRDGCGAKFPDDDERIVGQEVGEIENPDLADTWNTVVKIAKKRAYVDAILAATAASAVFTQDAEDSPAAADQPAVSPMGEKYPEDMGAMVGAACVQLAGGDRQSGVDLWKRVGADCGGYVPHAAALALIAAAEAAVVAANGVPDIKAPDPS